MSPRVRTMNFTLFLLKESLKSFKEALRKPDSLAHLPLKKELPFDGEFWYRVTHPHPPKWQEFVNTLLESESDEMIVSSASGVLFIKSSGRLFAFTFGHGRHLLKPDSYEPRFGLKVVLNRVSPDRLRSIDIRTYEDIVVSTRKQTSRSAQIDTFGLDVSRDILRAVTGEPNNPAFAKRIAGADSLTITIPVTDNLEQKCREILNAYLDNEYKKRFEWIDNLREARKPLIDKLNSQLVECLKKGKTDKLHLAPPEVLDWQSVDKFRIDGSGSKEYDDLDIDEYLTALGDRRQDLTIEKLKSYQVSIRWAGSDQFFRKWPLFNCIVWETRHGDKLYVLVEGKWFEIDNNFAKRVYSFVKSLPSPQSCLPPAREKENEPDYNERAAAESEDLFCLDGFLVTPQDAATPIEFCDLLSKKRHLIYVKRKTRSATLSHLFAQATVATRTFLQDGTVRARIRGKLKELDKGAEKLIPNKKVRPNPTDYEIVYAIIAQKDADWPDSLPFFSQLNLMQHARQLNVMGFRVALVRIAEEET